MIIIRKVICMDSDLESFLDPILEMRLQQQMVATDGSNRC